MSALTDNEHQTLVNLCAATPLAEIFAVMIEYCQTRLDENRRLTTAEREAYYKMQRKLQRIRNLANDHDL